MVVKRIVAILTLVLAVTFSQAQTDYKIWSDSVIIDAFSGTAALTINGGDVTLTKFVNGTGTTVLIINKATGTVDTITSTSLAVDHRVSGDTIFVESDTLIVIDNSTTNELDSLLDASTGLWLSNGDTISSHIAVDSLSSDADSLYWFRNTAYKDGFYIGSSINEITIEIDSTNHTATSDTLWIIYNSISSDNDTVTLPNTNATNVLYSVKDLSGTASVTRQIVVVVTGGGTIDGQVSGNIVSSYGWMRFKYIKAGVYALF